MDMVCQQCDSRRAGEKDGRCRREEDSLHRGSGVFSRPGGTAAIDLLADGTIAIRTTALFTCHPIADRISGDFYSPVIFTAFS